MELLKQEKKNDCLQTISFIFVNYYSNNTK
jgi:hypothetical protein